MGRVLFFTFGIKGGYESGLKMLDTVELFSHVANIGHTHSLILHPASTTHRQLPEEQLITADVGAEVIRLSIGIECVEDLITDLDQALERSIHKQQLAALSWSIINRSCVLKIMSFRPYGKISIILGCLIVQDLSLSSK